MPRGDIQSHCHKDSELSGFLVYHLNYTTNNNSEKKLYMSNTFKQQLYETLGIQTLPRKR